MGTRQWQQLYKDSHQVELFLAVTSLGGPKEAKIFKYPFLIVENSREKPPQNRSGFWFLSFFVSLSFSTYFSLFPAVSRHLEPPQRPTK